MTATELRLQREELLYRPILKEMRNDIAICEAVQWHPIDDHMYIMVFMTGGGIQSCGLYFKVVQFDEPNGYIAQGMPIKMCRISMERPEYIKSFNENFTLTIVQKMKLIEVLHEPEPGYGCSTVWEYMIKRLNSIHHYAEIDPYPNIPFFDKTMVIPDYSRLL